MLKYRPWFENDQEYFQKAKEIQYIIKKMKECIQNKDIQNNLKFDNLEYSIINDEKLLEIAEKSVLNSVDLIQNKNIPLKQLERDKIFDLIAWSIMDDTTRWGELGRDILMMDSYFAVRKPDKIL